MSEIVVDQKSVQQYGALCFGETPEAPKIPSDHEERDETVDDPRDWPIFGLSPRRPADATPGGGWHKLMQDGPGIHVIRAPPGIRRCRKRFPEMAQRDSLWLALIEAARRRGTGPWAATAEIYANG